MLKSEETFSVLSVLLKREGVMARLADEPADKRTLAADLDCSRSTIDRAVRDLEPHGLITYEEGRYELTPLGEYLTQGVIDLLEGIEVARDLQPVLEHLPIAQFDLDLRHLETADVYLPEPGNPWAMVNRHVRVLEEADRIRAVLPLTGLHATRAVHDRVIDHDADVEMVGCPEVIRTFLTDPDFAELVGEMDATGRHRMFQLNERPPYFLGLIDDIVQLGVDEAGEPRAIVESTDPEVRAWAERVYERSKGQATRVEFTETEAVTEEVAGE